jgi:protein TonB
VKAWHIILVLEGCLLVFPGTALASQATSGQPQQKTSADVPRRVRVGGQVMGSKLIRRIDPEYPEMAKKNHIRGTVHLQIVIDRDGKVIETKVLGGDPLLAQAAIEALRQWVYRPTTINREPVQVQTDVDIDFKPHR